MKTTGGTRAPPGRHAFSTVEPELGVDARRSDPGSKSTRQGILIVDDEPIARLGLATLISEKPDLTFCGEAVNTAQGLGLMNKAKPALTILDIAVEGDRGLEFIKCAQEQCEVLVFSLREETLYAERCLLAGAKGYVSKRESVETVQAAIQEHGPLFAAPGLENTR